MDILEKEKIIEMFKFVAGEIDSLKNYTYRRESWNETSETQDKLEEILKNR